MATIHLDTQVSFTSDGIVYIQVEDREAFDRIRARLVDHGPNEEGGHVLVKRVERVSIVIFQHWIALPIHWSPAHRKAAA
jgi:hypothetical protein